jgi:hypothetical protein
MAYRALKRLHLGDEVYKEPGEMVPEALEWSNVRVWLSTGFIEEVPDPEPVKAAPRRSSTTKKAKED